MQEPQNNNIISANVIDSLVDDRTFKFVGLALHKATKEQMFALISDLIRYYNNRDDIERDVTKDGLTNSFYFMDERCGLWDEPHLMLLPPTLNSGDEENV